MDGLSVMKTDFKWPYPKPLTLRPAAPPLKTIPEGFFMRRPHPGICHCDTHQYDAEMNQYQALAEKENILITDLIKLRKKLTSLSNGMLDHPCDDDDVKLETVYQTDYKKRGLPLVTYRKMMEAVDSKASDPIRFKSGERNGYRDPTRFRYTAIIRPVIDTPTDAHFATTPDTFKAWFEPITGKTEYQDTISKTGIGIIRNCQQYREPLPSTRRRFGDPNL